MKDFMEFFERENPYSVCQLFSGNRGHDVKIGLLITDVIADILRRKGQVNVLINGNPDSGKSLFADTILSYFNACAKERYQVPKADKMSLEKYPTSASEDLAVGNIQFNGEDIAVYFLRSWEDIKNFNIPESQKKIVIVSQNGTNHFNDKRADVSVIMTLDKSEKYEQERQWVVHFLSKISQTEIAKQALMKLKNYRNNKLFKPTY